MQPVVSFIQISDTHIGPTRDYDYYGYRPIDTLNALVDHLNNLPTPPDFIVHTGDISHTRDRESYTHARAALAQLKLPIHYVNGNHDDRALVRDMLGAPEHITGKPDAPLDYTFTVNGERFIVLDACHPDRVKDPLGYVDAAQLAWLRGEMATGDERLTLFVHYPLFPMQNEWFNQHMLITNAAILHETLQGAGDRLRGVFFGHQHRGAQVVRDGISYVAAPSAIMQYGWRPWDVTPQADHDTPPGYNAVFCYPDRTLALHYTFPRPRAIVG